MSANLLKRSRVAVAGVPRWRKALYVDGALAGVYVVAMGGTVLTGIILWSGGGPFDLGLLSALTTGGGACVLFAQRLQRRAKSPKRLTQLGWGGARSSWLPLAIFLGAATAFHLENRAVVVPLVLATAFVAAALLAIGSVGWYGWVAQIVPAARRGGFLAQRTRWASVAALVALPVGGLLLDKTKAFGDQSLGFALILLLPPICAVVGWRLMASVPLSIPSAPPDPVRTSVRASTISARRYAIYTTVWQASVYFASPFFQAYALDRLGLSFSLLMDLQMIAQIIPILTLGWWGQIIDRIGLRLPLGICSIGKALVPLCYLVSTRQVWWPFVISYVLSILDAGITVSNGTAFAAIADNRDGSVRVARLNLLISIVASVTPVVAGYLVAHIQLIGLDMLAVMFVISSVGRACSGVILLVPGRINATPRTGRRPIPTQG